MAATPETHDRTETQLPAHWTTEWPTLERDHDPRPLTSNDPRETTQTTLDRFGLECPPAPDCEPRWTDTRDHTEQTSVFEYPTEWWDDADRLADLFERFDTVAPIADLLSGAVCFETVRDRLKTFGIRDPEEPKTMAERLEAADPGDCGDPLPEAFNGGGAA